MLDDIERARTTANRCLSFPTATPLVIAINRLGLGLIAFLGNDAEGAAEQYGLKSFLYLRSTKLRTHFDFSVLKQAYSLRVSHYLFEPCFARVGEGHDKGGVEGRGNAVRLQHLRPIPQGKSLRELSEVNAEGKSVMERFGEDTLETPFKIATTNDGFLLAITSYLLQKGRPVKVLTEIH